MKLIVLLFTIAISLNGFSQQLSKDDAKKVDNSIRTIKSYVEPWNTGGTIIVQPAAQKTVRMHSCGGTRNNLQHVVIVIDGVVKDMVALEKINPNDIESVNVLKGASAIAVYGEKAKEGAIIVTMKCKEQKAPVL